MEFKPTETTELYDEYCDKITEAYFGMDGVEVTPEMNQQVANVITRVNRDGETVIDTVEGTWSHVAYDATLMATALYREGKNTALTDYLSVDEIDSFVETMGYSLSFDTLEAVEKAFNDTFEDPRNVFTISHLYQEHGLGYDGSKPSDVGEMVLHFEMAFRMNNYPIAEKTEEAMEYMSDSWAKPEGYFDHYLDKQTIDLLDELVERMKNDNLKDKEMIALHEMLRSDLVTEQVMESEWMRHRGHYFGIVEEIRQVIKTSKTPHDAAETMRIGAMLAGELEDPAMNDLSQEEKTRVQEETEDVIRDMVLIVHKAGPDMSEEDQWKAARDLCERIYNPELHVKDWFRDRYEVEIPISF